MSVRLSAANRRAFRHGGFELDGGWKLFDALTDEQRATLKAFHGRHVRVHPDDLESLESYGLKFDGGTAPLLEHNPTPAKPTGDAAPTTTKTPKPAKASPDARKDQ